jgi:hypothetical protein
MIYYPGYCKKYGDWVPFTAKLAPTFLNMAVATGVSSINNISETALLIGAFIGMISGIEGFQNAHSAHIKKDKELFRSGIGLTKGSEIVRHVQKKAYAVPVLVGLAFSAATGYALGLVEPSVVSKDPCPNVSERLCVKNATQPRISLPVPAVS